MTMTLPPPRPRKTRCSGDLDDTLHVADRHAGRGARSATSPALDGSGHLGDRRAAVPRRRLVDPGRVPRRRGVLRHQRLPDHALLLEESGTRTARIDRGPLLAAAGPGACCRRCSPCSWPSSLYAVAVPARRGGQAARRRRRRPHLRHQLVPDLLASSRTSRPSAGRRRCATCGRWRWRSSSTSSGRCCSASCCARSGGQAGRLVLG